MASGDALSAGVADAGSAAEADGAAVIGSADGVVAGDEHAASARHATSGVERRTRRGRFEDGGLERETRLELATSTLGRWRSTN